jgi:hypothetical protein
VTFLVSAALLIVVGPNWKKGPGSQQEPDPAAEREGACARKLSAGWR